MNDQRHVLPRPKSIIQANDVKRLRSVKLQSSRIYAFGWVLLSNAKSRHGPKAT
jgi:hypothetical protein